MARQYIPEDVSPYYPRRARWYSKIFYWIEAIVRGLRLDHWVVPEEIQIKKLALALLVPGLGIYFRRPRQGRVVMTIAPVLLLVFLIGLGFSVGNIAFGLLISLHVTSLIYYCEPLLVHEPITQRISFTIIMLLLMGFGIYWPVRGFVQGYLFLPLLMPGRVVVIHPSSNYKVIHRGDWVAYQLDEDSTGDAHHGGEVIFRGGMDFGAVLGVAGDRVTFSNDVFAVNGIWQTNRPHMPGSGSFIVRENHWFIWPEFAKSGHGNVSESVLSGILMDYAQVDMTQYRGKPYGHWFGRKQVLP